MGKEMLYAVSLFQSKEEMTGGTSGLLSAKAMQIYQIR